MGIRVKVHRDFLRILTAITRMVCCYEKGQIENELECDGVPGVFWCQEWKKLIFGLCWPIFDLNKGVRI